jgi:hypothetical protein
MRILLPILLALVVACGAHSSRTYLHSAAPNPNGCYVEVFPREQFAGARDFINGPGRYARISDLPQGTARQGGIRSARTGPGAIATVWSDESYRGSLLRLGPDQQSPRLLDALGGKGLSIQIACNRVAAE